MSEVKRYVALGGMIEVEMGFGKGVFVEASDLDRVTAERDAALGRESLLREFSNLQAEQLQAISRVCGALYFENTSEVVQRICAERDVAMGREAALREELSTANGCLNEWRRSTLGRTLLENIALQQRLTAADERADVLERDAARYRWLRDPDNQEDLEPDSDYLMPPIICGYAEHEDILSMEALDKAIDSAMSEAPKP